MCRRSLSFLFIFLLLLFGLLLGIGFWATAYHQIQILVVVKIVWVLGLVPVRREMACALNEVLFLLFGNPSTVTALIQQQW